MHEPLPESIRQLLTDPATVKVMATTDATGAPYAVVSPFLQLGDDGRLVHLELLETAATNRHLLRSLWFDRQIAVSLTGTDGRSYVVRGKPGKALITGPVFSRYYRQVRETLGDVDLATVWYIDHATVHNETFVELQAEEEAQSPFHIHLDRLAAATTSP